MSHDIYSKAEQYVHWGICIYMNESTLGRLLFVMATRGPFILSCMLHIMYCCLPCMYCNEY